MTEQTDDAIINGLRLAESVRSLDERTALKVALALAGWHPELYSQILTIVRSQNMVPASTLVLNPPNAKSVK